MYIDLKWKIPLILFVILGAAFLAYPLKDKIALGLDLQGGMHLVLEVQTEKAVEASLERIADDIKREIENEDYEVDRVRANLENKTVTVLMVDAIDLEAVEEIMKSYTVYLNKEGKVREGRGYRFSLSKEEEKHNTTMSGPETSPCYIVPLGARGGAGRPPEAREGARQCARRHCFFFSFSAS